MRQEMEKELHATLYSDGSADSVSLEVDLILLEIPYNKLYKTNDPYSAYNGVEVEMNRYPFSARTRDGIWTNFIFPILAERGLSLEEFYEREKNHGKS